MRVRILLVGGFVVAASSCAPKDSCGGVVCTAEQRCTPTEVCVTDTPPSLSVDAPIDAVLVTTSSLQLKGSAKDDLGAPTVEVSLNGGAWTKVALASDGTFSTQVVLPSADGVAAALKVRATDSKGREVSITRGLKVDNVSPACAIITPADGAAITSAGIFTLTLTASDGSLALVNPRVSTDGALTFATPGGADGSYSLGWVVVAANGATHELVFQVDDRAGHSCEARRTVTVDTVKPELLISLTPGTVWGPDFFARGGVLSGASVDGLRAVDSVTVEFADAGVRATTLDKATGRWFIFLAAPTGDDYAPRTARAVATDLAGNTASATVDLFVDVVPPRLTITGPAANARLNAASFDAGDDAPLTWTLTDGDPQVSIGMALADGGLAAPVVVTTSPTDNPATYQPALRAADRGGNVTTASISFSVDRVPPTVGFASPDAGSLLGPAFFASGGGLSGPVSDGPGVLKSVTVEFADAGVRAATVQSGSWAIGLTAPAGDDFKAQTATVVATDLADNTARATLSLRVDVVAPTLAITAPAANARLNVASFPSGDNVGLAWTSTDGDPAATVGIVLADGGVQVPAVLASSPTDNPKAYQPTLVARDRAGNSRSASVSFTVDRVLPAITSRVPVNNTRMHAGAAWADFSEPMIGGDGLTMTPAAAGAWTTAQRWTVGTLAKDSVYLAAAGPATDLHGNPLAASSSRFHTATWVPRSGDTLATGYTAVSAAVTDPEGVLHLTAVTGAGAKTWLRFNPSTGSEESLGLGTANLSKLVAWRTVQADLSSRRLAGLSTAPNQLLYAVGVVSGGSVIGLAGEAFIPTPPLAGETGQAEFGVIRAGQYERDGGPPIAVGPAAVDELHLAPDRWELVRFKPVNAVDVVGEAQTFGCYWDSWLIPERYACWMRPMTTSAAYSAIAPRTAAISSGCSALQVGAVTSFIPWQPTCSHTGCVPSTSCPSGAQQLVADRDNDGTFYSFEGVGPYQVRKVVLDAACVGSWVDVGAPVALPNPPRLVVIRGTPGLIYADGSGNLKFVTP